MCPCPQQSWSSGCWAASAASLAIRPGTQNTAEVLRVAQTITSLWRTILLLTNPRFILSLLFSQRGDSSGLDYAEQYRQTAEAIQAQCGLESPWPPLRALILCADITLLFTIHEMQPAAFTLDRTSKFIGPCSSRATMLLPFPPSVCKTNGSSSSRN